MLSPMRERKMGKPPSCWLREKEGDGRTKLSKGPWTADEDRGLIEYMVRNNGHHGNWQHVPEIVGIKRCGKSCRLRWTNYLRPGINRSAFSDEEDKIIINLHSMIGNRWAAIARVLPGRTDNDVKNHWNTRLSKKLLAMGIDPRTHSLLPDDLHPDVKSLQANMASIFAKLNNRETSHSALLSLWLNNNAAMTAPLQGGAFQSYTGGDYVVHNGTVDLQQLATVSAPCSDVSNPNMMASTSRDVAMAIAQPNDPGSSGNWWTIPAPLNEPPANMAASHLTTRLGQSMSSGDAVITESTISNQFGKINNADLGELEDHSDEFLNKLLNYQVMELL